VHPTRCQQEFVDSQQQDSTTIMQQLLEIAKDGMSDGTVCAIGELGLDYDRLEFCSKDVQLTWFAKQLEELARPTQLPLFLHHRNVTNNDFTRILSDHQDCWKHAGGVVHSFDDSIDLAKTLIDEYNLYIGLNGCSLRTLDNLQTVQQLPLDRILLETDCPYCDIRPTHAGYQHVQTHFHDTTKPEKKFQAGYLVKNRQEPCQIVQVAEIVAGVKQVTVETVAQACWENANKLFRFHNTL
jgi:TatD DNase family protein